MHLCLVGLEIQDILIYGATLCKENSKYSFLNDLKICYTSLNKLTKTEKVGEVLIKGRPAVKLIEP